MVQPHPEVSAIFRQTYALDWLDHVTESNSVLSAILAVIHPTLHKSGWETFNWLRQCAKIQPENVLHQWTSIFNGVAVIINCTTPAHQDSNTRKQWYNLLVTLGSYWNCNLNLPGMGVSFKYGPGTVVGLLGVTLEHEVPCFEGERVCYAFFMRDNVHEWAGVSGYNWMATEYYD